MMSTMTSSMFWELAFLGLVGLYFIAVVGVFTPALIESLSKFKRGEPMKTLRDYQIENEEEQLAELEVEKSNKRKKTNSENMQRRVGVFRYVMSSQRHHRISYARVQQI